MRRAFHIAVIGLAAVAGLAGCTRTGTYTPALAEIAISVEGLAGVVAVAPEDVFDRLEVEIKGVDWSVIRTVESQVAGGVIVLDLPDELPAEELCKVARDDYRDYEGFWPAKGVSDRAARVAGLGDIFAYRGDERVGRVFLSDWDGAVQTDRLNSRYVHMHYADRPFELSGENLSRPDERPSFRYEASFVRGWNIYIERYGVPYDQRTLTTTDIPSGVQFVWRLEAATAAAI
ncbi:MAG: hypothetical protein LBV38_02415 [Alistipes sp.]|jgi:hypothetical protein|nr:hypothetical protein [Alistipes sp.]